MPGLFKTVALVGKYDSPEMGDNLPKLADFLRRLGYAVLIAHNTADRLDVVNHPTAALKEIGQRADLVVVVGGDGTMLSIARMLVGHDVPLVGVNQGRLGFLTDVPVETMCETLAEILAGEYVAENRLLLNTSILRQGETIFSACAFNDVVMSRGSTGRLIEFDAQIDGEYVYSQRSDGLVIATPTGSTAYALSAGGPILHPGLEAFIMVPICPHTLSARPIVVNSHSVVALQLTYGDDARVHFDGQSQCDIKVGDVVEVTRSPALIQLLHPKTYSYYRTLREKLYWGKKL
ncbi:MAG: NAD kinase [Sulfuriferula sp.]